MPSGLTRKSVLRTAFQVLIFCPMVLTAAQLDIQVFGIRNARGTVRCAVYRGPEGFPDLSKHAIRRSAISASSGKIKFVFTDIKPGRYAASVFHDENDNGKLDKNLLSIPKEGYVISNNPSRARSPRYKDAEFSVNEPTTQIELRMHY